MEFEVLVEHFWNHTLPYREWNHAAHLAVALDAVLKWGRDDAFARLRDGIRAYNQANEVVNSPMGGYHETLTLFFVGAIADFYNTHRDETEALYPLLLEAWGNKNAVLTFYSRRHLFSPYARMEWRAPDLQPIPFQVPMTAEPDA